MLQPRPKKKPVTKKVAPAPLAVKKPVVKKVVNQLFEKRPKNFGIGKCLTYGLHLELYSH